MTTPYSLMTEEQKIKCRNANKRWRDNNREHRKNYMKEYDKSRPKSNRLFKAAKERANKFQLDFNIDESDVFVPHSCPICHQKLEVSSTRGGWKHSPTLDKVKPDLGYVKGNVAVICKLCNSTKGSGSANLHRQIADYIDNF